MKIKEKFIHSRLSNLILFDTFLVMTPFLMLLGYLQRSVRALSDLSFTVFDTEIPYIVAVFLLGFIITTIKLARKITLLRAAVVLFAAGLWVLGQYTSDYYLGHLYYDLQNNWHYIAYASFAVLMYKYMKQAGYSDEKIILFTFIKALILSSFDEGFQYFLSDRIFDLCDIAKDLWGAVIGLILIYGCYDEARLFKNAGSIRKKKISAYFKSPKSLIFFEIIAAYMFLFFSSILTATDYFAQAIFIPIGVFLVIFMIYHLTQFKIPKIVIITSFIIGFSVLVYTVINDYDKGMQFKNASISYRGVPIPYFDFIIFPDGSFRLTDKKEKFTGTDKYTLIGHEPDILILGSGSGSGGKGFDSYPYVDNPQFIYNQFTSRGIQYIVLRNAEACRMYNDLKSKGKSVMLVIHNS